MKTKRKYVFLVWLLCLTVLGWGTPIKVACVGNSITYGAGIVNRDKNSYPAQLQAYLGEKYEVRNFGRNGATALLKGDYPYMETEEYKQSLAFLPDIVFIKLGTNDSKPQNIKYKRKFKSDYLKLIRSYQELSSHPRIILLGPVRCFLSLDDNIKESVIQGMLAPVIKEITKEEKLEYVEMHDLMGETYDASLMPDRLHPSSIGAGRMAMHLCHYLEPTTEKANPCTFAIPGNEYRSAAGWKEGADWHAVSEEITQILSRKKLDILFLGNSITQGFGGSRELVTYKPGKAAVDSCFKDLTWESAGISGDRTENLLWRLRHGKYGASKPAYAVITIGINNVNAGHRAADIAEGICAVVEETRKQMPETQILLMGLLPAGLEKTSPMRMKCDSIHSILQRKTWGDVVYVNPTSWFVQSDGSLVKAYYGGDFLHLTPAGYLNWCKHLKEYIHIPSVLSGGGDLNPDLKAPEKALERWQDLRIGLSVHWGPSALGGKEIGWSRGTSIPAKKYDQFYKRFNPNKFDAEEWCQLMKRWGIRYVSPTSKHHDGFSIWFSDYSDYDMENAARKIDILGELKKACDRNGVVLGAYYSNIDWYHPDWTPNDHGGPGPLFKKQADSPNLERYFKYMEDQVTEIIRKYDLAFIQFDGEWDDTYTHEVGSHFYRRFHEVKPDILLNTRIDIGRRSVSATNHVEIDGKRFAGDFQDRERLVNHGNNVTKWADHPWQAWVTIDKRQWSYNPNPQLMTAEELIKDMVHVVGNNGNYMINLGPRPDGSFDKPQIALMDTLGMWLNSHAEMIYGTRGGPFYPFPGGVSTRKGNKAWIMVTDKSLTEVCLPRLLQTFESVTDYETHKPIEFYVKDDEYIHFVLPEAKDNEPVRVIELLFDAEVKMCPRQPVYETGQVANEQTNGYY